MNVLLVCVVLLALLESATAQTLLTVAGGGPSNLSALQTGLPGPFGIAVDPSGNVYVSTTQDQIWIIDNSGKIRVFAGNGTINPPNSSGYGDGLQATDATLYNPGSLLFDSFGNLLVLDTGHHSVRKISGSGVISTVAGQYSQATYSDPSYAGSFINGGFSQMAIDSANNLYVSDTSNRRIWQISSAGVISSFAGGGNSGRGDGGLATSANLMYPVGVAVDASGSVYISDSSDCRIRKVTSGTISTFAGTGVCGSSGNGQPALSAAINPSRLIIDRFNNLYILSGCSVREVAANQPNITAYLGGSACGMPSNGTPMGSAQFGLIAALAFDASGSSTYIVDEGNYRIWKASSGLVSSLAGNGTAYFVNDGQLAANAYFAQLSSLSTDNAGKLIFSDGTLYAGSSAVRSLSLNTGILGTVAGSGVYAMSADGSPFTSAARGPNSAVFAANGDVLFIEGNRIRKITNGVYATIANNSGGNGFIGDGGLATAAQLNPYLGIGTQLAVASNGDLFIADAGNYRIRQISAKTGIIATIAGAGGSYSSGDGGLALNANLNNPGCIALDGLGDLFFCEPDRVRKIVLSTGIITTVAGGPSYTYQDGVVATASSLTPQSIFADQSANLFIADIRNYRIRKVSAGTNIISTIAGTGSQGVSPDGGSAASSAVTPIAITVDRSQALYFIDSPANAQAQRVRTFPITACFFSLGAPAGSFNSGSGTGSVSISATNSSCPYSVASDSPFVTITSGSSGTGTGTVTFTISPNTGAPRSATLSFAGQSFVVNQTGGNAQHNVGSFLPSGPTWALDSNGSGGYDAADRLFSFGGEPGAIAVTGDWNGDGKTKVGYYLNGFWVLDYNGNGSYDPPNDKFYAFGGNAGDIPVVGDWNGDGKTKIGLYRKGFWILDYNGNGSYDGTGPGQDRFIPFGGNANEFPILGDWNHDGRTKIGVFYGGNFALDYDGDGQFTAADKFSSFLSYNAGDRPVTGDWTGDGKTKIGIYRNGFWILDTNNNGTYDGIAAGQDKFYGFGGNPGDVPIVADWNGTGTDKVGVYNAGFWVIDFNGSGSYEGVGAGQDRVIGFYLGTGSQPIIGKW